MQKTILLCLAVILSRGCLFAQGTGEDPKISLKFDVRFDGTYTGFADKDSEEAKEDEGGFVGRYLKLIADGKINEKISYGFRHRLYMEHTKPKEFFSSTDWAWLTFHFNRSFSVTAGKQIVGIGGCEYDYAPIDMYFWSDFWNNVKPYQIGINIAYTNPRQTHTIKFQITNSPFSTKALENIYAYNLLWYGTFGWFQTLYSVNMMEYEKGHFINYIALGNKFTFKNFSVDLDYMNRASFGQDHFFADFSIIGKVDYAIGKYFKVFAKGGYDQNKAQEAGAAFIYDRYVVPGVKYGFYGAGMEYFPLNTKNNNVRIHAFWTSNNSKPVPQTFNIGIRWQMKVLER